MQFHNAYGLIVGQYTPENCPRGEHFSYITWRQLRMVLELTDRGVPHNHIPMVELDRETLGFIIANREEIPQ